MANFKKKQISTEIEMALISKLGRRRYSSVVSSAPTILRAPGLNPKQTIYLRCFLQFILLKLQL